MNHRQNKNRSTTRNQAYRQALERLDDALEKNNPWDNSAKIAAMRKACFADVEEFAKNNPLVLPEQPKY